MKTIDKKTLKMVEELASHGLTMPEIATHLGIKDRQFRRWRANDSALAAAVERGKIKGHEVIANKLFELAAGGNLTAAIFYLKCRCGWKEGDATTTVNVTQSAPETVDISNLTPAERDDFIRKAFEHRDALTPAA